MLLFHDLVPAEVYVVVQNLCKRPSVVAAVSLLRESRSSEIAPRHTHPSPTV